MLEYVFISLRMEAVGGEAVFLNHSNGEGNYCEKCEIDNKAIKGGEMKDKKEIYE